MQSLLPHFPDQRHLSSLQDCRRCLGTYSIPNRIRSSLSRNHRNSARIHWSLSRTHWSLNRNHRSSARKNFHPSFPIPKASFPYRLSNRRNPTGHPANRFRSPVHFRHLHCSRFPNWNPPPGQAFLDCCLLDSRILLRRENGCSHRPVQYEAEDQSGHQNLKSFVLLFRHMVLLVLLSSSCSKPLIPAQILPGCRSPGLRITPVF